MKKLAISVAALSQPSPAEAKLKRELTQVIVQACMDLDIGMKTEFSRSSDGKTATVKIMFFPKVTSAQVRSLSGRLSNVLPHNIANVIGKPEISIHGMTMNVNVSTNPKLG